MSKFPDLALAFLLLGVPAKAAELGVGRAPLPAEVAAWDIDARPDGKGLPPGRGTVKQGEAVFQERCSGCHGEFGEGAARWPELAGGAGTLTAERPLKTIGSFWPYASSVFDYVRRAMPFGQPQSLTNDELYAVVGYVLSLNDVITDENFVLDRTSLPKIQLPNEGGFFDDNREVAERSFWTDKACMANCKPEVHITGRASTVDVTPDSKTAPKVE